VVGVNRHGSTGFGRDFCDCLGQNWGSHPLIDLENGLDYALAQYPYLDAHKVVGLGFSYGGYLVNWLNSHSNKYRALVNHGGMFSLMGTYYGIDELFFAEREVNSYHLQYR
jgi:dipeptidyl aminopeptidase/acylaminoacyl peptidase